MLNLWHPWKGQIFFVKQAQLQIPFHFSSFFHNLTHKSILDVSPVLKYAKLVAPSVGLMSQLPILAPQKASDRQSTSTK